MQADVGPILWLSLMVSGTAVLVASSIGLPLGLWLGRLNFRGRRAVWALVYTGMGFPPVVVGLLVYLLLSRTGSSYLAAMSRAHIKGKTKSGKRSVESRTAIGTSTPAPEWPKRFA